MCYVSKTRKRIDLYPCCYINKALPVDWTWVDYQFQGVPPFKKRSLSQNHFYFLSYLSALRKCRNPSCHAQRNFPK